MPFWDCFCFWWNTKHSGHVTFLLLSNYLAWPSHSRAMRGYQMRLKLQEAIWYRKAAITYQSAGSDFIPDFFISPSYVIYFSFERKAWLTFYEKVYSFPNKTSNSIIELIIELYLDTTLYINRSIYLPYFIFEFNYYNCIWYKFIDDYCRPLDLHKIQWSKSFSLLD